MISKLITEREATEWRQMFRKADLTNPSISKKIWDMVLFNLLQPAVNEERER